jgi:hypothetical protein
MRCVTRRELAVKSGLALLLGFPMICVPNRTQITTIKAQYRSSFLILIFDFGFNLTLRWAFPKSLEKYLNLKALVNHQDIPSLPVGDEEESKKREALGETSGATHQTLTRSPTQPRRSLSVANRSRYPKKGKRSRNVFSSTPSTQKLLVVH